MAWGLWFLANGIAYALAKPRLPVWATVGFWAIVIFGPVAYYRSKADESFVAYLGALIIILALMIGR